MSSDSTMDKNISSKYDLVILNKVDAEGNFSLLHTKPLTVELFYQVIEIFFLVFIIKFIKCVLQNRYLNLHSYFPNLNVPICLNIHWQKSLSSLN